MRPCGSLWVFIGAYAFIWVFMGPYKSLSVFLCLDGSLLVVIRLYM